MQRLRTTSAMQKDWSRRINNKLALSLKSKGSLCNAGKSSPLLEKQKYLISCFLPVLFLVFVLTCMTRRKNTISRNLKSNFRSETDCPEPLPGRLPCISLEYSSSIVVKVTNSFSKYLSAVDTVVAYHLNAKVVHHFCYAKDWSIRVNDELK